MLTSAANYNNFNVNQNKLYFKNEYKFLFFHFITNNYSFLSFFFYFNQSFYYFNNFSIKIKKNSLYFFNKINNFRRFFIHRKNIFKNVFRFNRLLLYSFIFKKKNNKNISLKLDANIYKNFFVHYYFKFYLSTFYRNWNFLIGGLLSPYKWDVYGKKKWFRKMSKFYLIKNNFYFNKKKNTRGGKYNNYRFLIKKIFLNSFFYFYKSNFNYSDLSFMVKNSNKFSMNYKSNYDWFYSKPYLFLNNYENVKKGKNYPNFLSIHFYRTCVRFFSTFRRASYLFKFKNFADTFFKVNNFINFYHLSKSNNILNVNFTAPGILIKNHYSSFLFKYNIVNDNKFILYGKKKLKKRNKFSLRFKYYFKSKNSRKNKILNSFYIFQNFSISRLFYLFYKTYRNKPSRRIKKSYTFLNTFSNFKFFRSLNLNWTTKKKKVFVNIFKFNFYKFFIKSLPFSYSNIFYKFSLSIKNKNKSIGFINYALNFRNSLIFKNLNRNFFLSKEKLSFISKIHSFLFTSDCNLTFFKFKKVYNLKKLIYSFSYKNEIQRYVLKKYIKTNFLSKFKNFNSNNFYLNNSDLSFLDLFNKKNNEFSHFLTQNTYYSKSWSFFNKQLNYVKNNINDESNFIIKRVKFKPGYMSLWREVRSVFQNSMSLNFKYQYRLTKYLSRYTKYTKFKTFLFSEMRIINILIKSRIFTDYSVVNLFITNNLIYVNGIVCSNINFQLFTNDFIQLIVSIKYYILYKWFLNLSLKKKNRLKNLAKKKITPYSDTDEKKKSYTLPKWILFSKNSIDDVSKYIEVDYFTLSIFLLYEPFQWQEINYYNFIDQKFGIINLYNWKYIT